MKSFGLAIIGTGAIANTVCKEITSRGRFQVVSVYSRTRKRAIAFAKKFGGRVLDTFDEAVQCEGVDAVYLATPHSCHYREILRCIELGVPVLSEKAFTINSKQTQAIIDKNRTSYVSEAMWTRYNPITIKVKELIDSGRLGKIISIKASFCYPYHLSGFSDRVIKREYGGGALLDIGVYPISYVEMLLGKPDRVESTMKYNKYSVDVDDKIVMHYGDTVCDIRASLRRLSLCSAKIDAEHGSVYIPLFYRPTRAYVNIDGVREVYKCKAGYIHEFIEMAKDVEDGRIESLRIPLQSSLSVMSILDDIRDSHAYRYDEDIESI